MAIENFIPKIKSNFINKATIRHEKNIDKYFKVHDTETFGDSYNQMYLAREIISRFAKRNGVKVDVYDAKKMASSAEYDDKFINDIGTKLSDKINVVVTDLHTGKSNGRIVAADTGKIYPKETQKGGFLIENKQDNVERYTKGHWVTEDTFLRNLYRNIESMISEVTKNTGK